jgi:hypothetical protein
MSCAPSTTDVVKLTPKVAAKKLSGPQIQVLHAMTDHKLVWRKRDNKCLLVCGEAPLEVVRRLSVQRLLNAGMVAGPEAVAKKDIGKFDAHYKLTPAGRAVVKST